MLGYSDSTKESGALASAWMLYRRAGGAGRVRAPPRRRADAVPRPGRRDRPWRRADDAGRAWPRPPGSVDGRLKLTEQGEVVADRYVNPQIALRHLEQLTFATIAASLATIRRVAAARGRGHG